MASGAPTRTGAQGPVCAHTPAGALYSACTPGQLSKLKATACANSATCPLWALTRPTRVHACAVPPSDHRVSSSHLSSTPHCSAPLHRALRQALGRDGMQAQRRNAAAAAQRQEHAYSLQHVVRTADAPTAAEVRSRLRRRAGPQTESAGARQAGRRATGAAGAARRGGAHAGRVRARTWGGGSRAARLRARSLVGALRRPSRHRGAVRSWSFRAPAGKVQTSLDFKLAWVGFCQRLV